MRDSPSVVDAGVGDEAVVARVPGVVLGQVPAHHRL
jgi:hypothetical protein